MPICDQWFSTEEMNDIRAAVVRDPTISRRSLALKICERLNGEGLTGQFQEAGARRALNRLQRKGAPCLPEARFFQPLRPIWTR